MVGNKKLSFKNVDGFSALSGGVIQITKNFKNFGEMTGDQDRGFKSISLKNSFFSIKNEIRIIYLPLKNIPENYFLIKIKNDLEIGQRRNANGKIVPYRDAFYLEVSGKHVRAASK